jgi:hypothetical protein
LALDGSGSFLTKHSGVSVEGNDVGFLIIAGRHGGESKSTPAYTTWQSLAEEKLGLKGARGTRIASGD